MHSAATLSLNPIAPAAPAVQAATPFAIRSGLSFPTATLCQASTPW